VSDIEQHFIFVELLITIRALASTILKVVYGKHVQNMHDPLVKNAEEAAAGLAATANPGTFLVDTFPICILLP
jgi:hypothetical protein